jgi:hypothetical protein
VGFSVVPAIDKVLPGTGPRMALSTATPAMPIEEGGYDVLCKHAAEFWPKSFSDGLRKAHADGLADVLSGVANFLGAIASLAPSLFCGGPDQLQATADKAASGAAKQVCDNKKDEADKNKKKFDYNKCIKDQTKVIKVNSTMPKVNPAAVWSSAHNGNIFFQVWSITNGEPPEIPTLKFGQVEDKESYHWAVAQAEFFSDCEDGEATWAVCEPLAMWRLKWKARVRRVIDPVTAFEMEVKGLIADAPAMLLDTAIQKVIGAATKNASGISGELWASALQTGGGMLTQILSGKLPDTSALADRLPFPEHERLIIH